jgi:hypothetical protein
VEENEQAAGSATRVGGVRAGQAGDAREALREVHGKLPLDRRNTTGEAFKRIVGPELERPWFLEALFAAGGKEPIKEGAGGGIDGRPVELDGVDQCQVREAEAG